MGGGSRVSDEGAALLAGVDRAAFAVALAVRLRKSGVVVGTTATQAFARALGTWEPRSIGMLYWMARVTLVQRQADLESFDAVFRAVFCATGLALDPAARRGSGPAGAAAARGSYRSVPGAAAVEVAGDGLPWATLPAAVAPADGDEAPLDLPERLPSRLSAVADVPFERLDPADLALLGDWLAEGLRQWPTRPSRRWDPHHSGRRVGLRPTMAAARRTGFEPVALVRTRPRRRPRRVVMLCDVSRSMQPYVAAYLHLQRAVAVATAAEVFAFSTSLTRLTAVLARTSSAEAAIEEATARVDDRFGGTRIATSLLTLLSSRHGEACRGALVVIASDGWDTDPTEAMVAAMSRLRRRAHRVLWLNPRLAAPGYEPLVGGMAAAAPYCDAVLPADRVGALGDVVRALVAGR